MLRSIIFGTWLLGMIAQALPIEHACNVAIVLLSFPAGYAAGCVWGEWMEAKHG